MIKQTAGRDQLGAFAPKFAQLNGDVSEDSTTSCFYLQDRRAWGYQKQERKGRRWQDV